MEKNPLIKDIFLFSQNSIRTFQNCPLKFKKRYIENLKWQSIPDPKARDIFQRGIDFHLMAQRYFLGMDLNYISSFDESLYLWVRNLQQYFPIDTQSIYLPEQKLRLSKNPLRLEANYDLLVLRNDEIEVWDFKTSKATSKNRNIADVYIQSLQTKVYLYMVKELSSLLAGKPMDAHNIKMHYWQPDPPEVIASITYSDEMHQSFETQLTHYIESIIHYDYRLFSKEQYQMHCNRCEFNPFCNQKKVKQDEVIEEFLIEDLDMDTLEELF